MLTPFSFMKSAVPGVPNKEKPRLASILAQGRNSCFSLKDPIDKRMFCFGNLRPVARSPLM